MAADQQAAPDAGLPGPDRSRARPEITADLERVCGRHESFDVATGDAGGKLSDRRGGVAWLRLAEGGHRVAQLAIDVDNAIGSHVFDVTHAPRPHLTVARGVTGGTLEDLRAATSQITMGWTVDRLVLFRSHTDPAGSIYEPKASVDLAERVSNAANHL